MKNCEHCIYYDFKHRECTLSIETKKCERYISIFECCTQNCSSCNRRCDKDDR